MASLLYLLNLSCHSVLLPALDLDARLDENMKQTTSVSHFTEIEQIVDKGIFIQVKGKG